MQQRNEDIQTCCRSSGAKAPWSPRSLPSAATPVLAASEAITMKPDAATRPRLAARARINKKRLIERLDFPSSVESSLISLNTPAALTKTISPGTPTRRRPTICCWRSQHGLDQVAALLAEPAAQLPNKVAANGVFSPNTKACDGNDNQKHRRERSPDIKRNGCALAQRVMRDLALGACFMIFQNNIASTHLQTRANSRWSPCPGCIMPSSRRLSTGT